MKIEVWSDIVCPFCYIGKRKLDHALAKFDHRAEVEVIWKSFQLSPGLRTDPNLNINQFLAIHKGVSLNEAIRMNEYVSRMAAETGLTYHFDKVVVANSFNAHRLLHFCRSKGKQQEAKELLFRSYFTEGKNIDDLSILVELARELGLEAGETLAVLESDRYAEDVLKDIREAGEVGAQGVPFFVFNRRYAISGAQADEVFERTLHSAYAAQ